MRAELTNQRSLSLSPSVGTTSMRPAVARGPKGEDGSNVLPTDAAIKAAIENPASLTAGALSATIDAALADLPTPVMVGARTVGLGDSNMIGNTASTTNHKATSPYTWSCILTNQRALNVWNAGVAGNTSAMMLARLDADVLAYDPDRVILMAGTNDMNVADQTACRAAITGILDRLAAAGVVVYVVSIPPFPTYSTRVAAHNAWLQATADARGLTYVDIFTSVTDGSGGWVPTYTSDNLHFTIEGARVAGVALAAAIGDTLPAAPEYPRPFRASSAGNYESNPLFATGTSGLPTGWVKVGGAAITLALVTREGFRGQACRLTRNDTSFGLGIGHNITGLPAVAIGDRFAVVAKFEGPATCTMTMQIAGTFARFPMNGFAGDGTQHIAYVELVATAANATPSMELYLTSNEGLAGDQFYVGEVAVVKLPALP